MDKDELLQPSDLAKQIEAGTAPPIMANPDLEW
jgi:hypothetical protein